MPFVRIDVIGPKEPAWRRAVLEGVRAGIEQGAGVPSERIMQRLAVIDPADTDLPPAKSDAFTWVDIAMIAGRTREQKAAVYRAIAEHLAAAPGIPEEDLMIVIHDPDKDCFGIAGRIAE
jgi:4-oxalocrotonate tautomerase family enzyme